MTFCFDTNFIEIIATNFCNSYEPKIEKQKKEMYINFNRKFDKREDIKRNLFGMGWNM